MRICGYVGKSARTYVTISFLVRVHDCVNAGICIYTCACAYVWDLGSGDVCMYVCVHVCGRVYLYAYLHRCTCIRTYLCISVRRY
jgi:hypothetical protein